MKIGITLHTGGDKEDEIVKPVVDHMDNYFLKGNFLKDKSYGGNIDDFLVVAYVVFPDDKENEEFARLSHKVQRQKDYYGDKGWLKTIVFALPFNPDLVSKMQLEEFRILLCNAILDRLENPEMKILKAFDYETFEHDVRKEIVNYRDNLPIS